VIDPGEQCDQSNLNGETCVSQGFATGVLKCGAGCVFDTSGCSAVRFVDNDDGTVSDLQTGLMWEKKIAGECVNLVGGHPIACFNNQDCTGNLGGGVCVSCLHCVNATYTWTSSGSPYPPDGTAFTDFLYQLDNCTSDGFTETGGFAGHCDWRLPTQKELDSIIDFDMVPGCISTGGGPCIDPAFGPTLGYYYWSSMTSSGYSSVPGDAAVVAAFGVPIGLSSALTIVKTFSASVRAVRGSLGCVPTFCYIKGANCGSIPDGCGGTLDCGSCPAPETCGGGGAANQCG
jgi:hypothetical protein